jgi:hypothetical protein
MGIGGKRGLLRQRGEARGGAAPYTHRHKRRQENIQTDRHTQGQTRTDKDRTGQTAGQTLEKGNDRGVTH